MTDYRAATASILLSLLVSVSACTGGEETRAAQPAAPVGAAGEQKAQEAPQPVNPRQRLAQIDPAIPFYAGAQYDGDLTRRDNVMLGQRYGNGTVVYTLTTEDSFPQVWHYYVTYLAQFRQFQPMDPFPPSNQVQRTIEVRLNDVMKDPFIPGSSLDADKDVMLQVAENEGGTGTVIRYVIQPGQPTPTSLAAAGANSTTTAAP